MGNATKIDSLKIIWPDGKQQLLTNVEADKPLTLNYKDAVDAGKIIKQNTIPVFTNEASKLGIKFKPKERDFVDYDIQPTLPHKLSQYGPGIVKGDGKALAEINNASGKKLYIATQNQDSVLVFDKTNNATNQTKTIRLLPEDFSAQIIYKDGRKSYTEFYYGSAYLSQSSRVVYLDKEVKEVIIKDFKGNKRVIKN